MARLWIKAMSVVVCLLLALLILPSAGAAYAQEGYSLKIIEPGNGVTVYTPEITVSIYYSVPANAFGVTLSAQIKLVSLDESKTGMDALFNDVCTLVTTPGWLEGSGTDTFTQWIASGWSSLGGSIPSGQYKLEAFIKDTGDIVASASSTFHFVTSSVIKSFSVNPTSVKIDLDNPLEVTLYWETTDAEWVSIDQGIGDVQAEGSMKVSPIEVELPDPAAGRLNYLAVFNLTAGGPLGLEEVATVSVVIQPLTFDEIFNAYQKWGNSPHTWADGSTDNKALVGPTSSGTGTNFLGGVTGLVGYTGFTRYGCQAMQYKTLVFLNELEANNKLIGWDYMPVRKILSGTESIDWVQHNAVVISQYGKDWRSGYLLDPHPKQKPAYYPVDSGWRNDWSDLVTAYGGVYPGLPGGAAAATGEYKLNKFNESVTDYFRAYTPWGPKVTTINITILDEGENIKISVHCPVDVLLTNTAGQRLGILPNNEWVFEFKPVDAYYWSDENGDTQWYFSLPKDTYDVSIDGTGSGTFKLLTYTGGESINDYGDNSIAISQQATISVEPGTVSELTLAGGAKVTPEAKAISSFLPAEIAPTTKITSAPTTEPTPAPTTTPEDKSLNLSFIGSIIGGVIVILLLLFLFGRRKK
jgi:hypothetical protein